MNLWNSEIQMKKKSNENGGLIVCGISVKPSFHEKLCIYTINPGY